jgi:hypothetical protein
MACKPIIRFFTTALLILAFMVVEVSARERMCSGSYQGRASSGTWHRSVERTPGQIQRSTAWQNTSGRGSHVVSKDWNRETGTGGYSSTTTFANGKIASRQGTVTRNGQASTAWMAPEPVRRAE